MKRLLAALLAFSTLPLAAQRAIPPNGATAFKDTSMLKPPAGAKVAIIEFEDLECSACASASPIVWAAMERYKIPRVHHDFLIPSHVWSRQAAIYARYLEDKVSVKVAEQYRHDTFAAQTGIAGPEDLQRFTQIWFRNHGQSMPFVIDPDGHCADQVQADCLLGMRLGVRHTPTIIVATAREWIEVTDPRELYAAIDVAEASVKNPVSVR